MYQDAVESVIEQLETLLAEGYEPSEFVEYGESGCAEFCGIEIGQGYSVNVRDALRTGFHWAAQITYSNGDDTSDEITEGELRLAIPRLRKWALQKEEEAASDLEAAAPSLAELTRLAAWLKQRPKGKLLLEGFVDEDESTWEEDNIVVVDVVWYQAQLTDSEGEMREIPLTIFYELGGEELDFNRDELHAETHVRRREVREVVAFAIQQERVRAVTERAQQLVDGIHTRQNEQQRGSGVSPQE